MTANDPLDALIHRDDSDVVDSSVPYLRLGSGLDRYAWGWTEKEQAGLPPPEGGSFFRGLLYGIPIAVALWAVLILALYCALRWWR